MLCLSLERQPAHDLIAGTAMAWMEALTDGRQWDADRDANRIRRAFVTLARTRRTWPAPADFLDALPRLEPLRALGSQAGHDPERVQRAIAEATAILDGKTQAGGPDA